MRRRVCPPLPLLLFICAPLQSLGYNFYAGQAAVKRFDRMQSPVKKLQDSLKKMGDEISRAVHDPRYTPPPTAPRPPATSEPSHVPTSRAPSEAPTTAAPSLDPLCSGAKYFLDVCESCVESSQCKVARQSHCVRHADGKIICKPGFCCPYTKKCVPNGSHPCRHPARCDPPCHQVHCGKGRCAAKGYPGNWVTCPGVRLIGNLGKTLAPSAPPTVHPTHSPSPAPAFLGLPPIPLLETMAPTANPTLPTQAPTTATYWADKAFQIANEAAYINIMRLPVDKREAAFKHLLRKQKQTKAPAKGDATAKAHKSPTYWADLAFQVADEAAYTRILHLPESKREVAFKKLLKIQKQSAQTKAPQPPPTAEPTTDSPTHSPSRKPSMAIDEAAYKRIRRLPKKRREKAFKRLLKTQEKLARTKAPTMQPTADSSAIPPSTGPTLEWQGST